jgi:hypothetical protein
VHLWPGKAEGVQFYLADTESGTDYSGDVTDTAIRQRVLCHDHVLTVFTARNMDVPVTVELHATEPTLDLENADHVVEAGLRGAGTLVIAAASDATSRLLSAPGNRRVSQVIRKPSCRCAQCVLPRDGFPTSGGSGRFHSLDAHP